MIDRTELADLFRDAGRAHHEAFLGGEGEDHDWALWYAQHLREAVNESLDRDFTVTELAELLATADRAAADVSSSEWPEFYAEFFLGLE